MTIIYNKHKQLATRRYLRKNSTITERMLWEKLRNKLLGAKFRRQYGIGNYIVDFCLPRLKLVIEIEGGIHDDEDEKDYDEERKINIKELGFRMLVFTNEEVERYLEEVLEKIRKKLN
ncbi:MAG: endonuclease domain-containing protein [Candidatus Falkowbacteria bacterium]